MKKLLPILLLLLISSCASHMSLLQEYKGKYRLVLLFSSNENRIRTQKSEIEKYKRDIKDRDILFFYLYENGQSWFENREVSSNFSFNLRKHFEIMDNVTTLVLIGKDGTEKFRQVVDINFPTLFQEIDRLPTRIREIREGK